MRNPETLARRSRKHSCYLYNSDVNVVPDTAMLAHVAGPAFVIARRCAGVEHPIRDLLGDQGHVDVDWNNVSGVRDVQSVTSSYMPSVLMPGRLQAAWPCPG